MSDGDDDGNYLRMWLIAGGIVLGSLVLLVVLQWLVSGNVVYDASDAQLSCVHPDQCERPGTHKLLAEFENTVSNLAYLLFGICALVRGLQAGLPGDQRPAMLVFGASLCFLAVCSGYYHATLNFAGTHLLASGGGALRGSIAIVEKMPKWVCAAPTDPHDLPQVLDVVGVYGALISLFLVAVESAFRLWPDAGISRRGWAAGVGFTLPAVGVVMLPVLNGSEAAGGPAAGLALLYLLVFLTLLVFGAWRASTGAAPHPVAMWGGWLIAVLLMSLISLMFKTDLHWDSTAVFVAMMFFTLGAIAASWILTRVPTPTPEFIILAFAFVLGIAPRVLDGYQTSGVDVTRKGLCRPDSVFQAHALWHVMSALALVLTFDMVLKARPLVGANATVLLPRSGLFADELRVGPTRMTVRALLLKSGLTAAALFLLVWCLAGDGSPLFGVGALLLAVVLWCWPLGRYWHHWPNGPGQPPWP